MTVELTVAPGKSSGQGFGSATGQYLDLFIKYDTRTLTGYGLRIVRTSKYGDAVDFILMRYEKGQSVELTEPVSSDVFRTPCRIRLQYRDNRLTAQVTTGAPSRKPRPGVRPEVRLETVVEPNRFTGTGLINTGSTGAGSTWLCRLEIAWE
ncbi:MAG: hypothetical protein LUD68_01795 [Rikenellaceae bacterium]|nr:hypothetical protein [Rikenellaceae bacterium]